jgi:hypothetical protein
MDRTPLLFLNRRSHKPTELAWCFASQAAQAAGAANARVLARVGAPADSRGTFGAATGGRGVALDGRAPRFIVIDGIFACAGQLRTRQRVDVAHHPLEELGWWRFAIRLIDTDQALLHRVFSCHGPTS